MLLKTLKMNFCFLQEHGRSLFLNLTFSSHTKDGVGRMTHKRYIFREIKTTKQLLKNMYMWLEATENSRSWMGSHMGGQGPGGLQKGTGEAEKTSPANIHFQKMTAPWWDQEQSWEWPGHSAEHVQRGGLDSAQGAHRLLIYQGLPFSKRRQTL